MNKKIQNDLKRLIPGLSTSIDIEDLERHSIDALNPNRAFRAINCWNKLPQIVVRPRNTNEVTRVVQYASTQDVPIVPWGGGSGVMGGAASVKSGIVLDLKLLNQIEAIDPVSRLTVVGAGMILKDLSRLLKPQGLILGHDPWSLPIATVGGAISTNGVGYLAGKFGSMGEQVLGLEVVMASGEIVQPKLVSKVAGPNLNSLFIGGEGSFGIITQAALFTPKSPELTSLHAVSFPDFDRGFEAVREMQSLGLNPALVDFSEEFPAEIQSNFDQSDITLYLGFMGFREEVLSQRQRALSICERYRGEDLGCNKAKEFWVHRHDSGERYKRDVIEGPHKVKRSDTWQMDYLHVAIPASEVLGYRRNCQQLFKSLKIPIREWSLWARTEFFSFLISNPMPSNQNNLGRIAEAVDEVLMLAQDLGGTMEYCHGVGLKHAHLLEREKGNSMEILRKWKKVVDPNGILNPGKLNLD